MSTIAPDLTVDPVTEAASAPTVASAAPITARTRPGPPPRIAPATGRTLRRALAALPALPVVALAAGVALALLAGRTVPQGLLWVLVLLAVTVLATGAARRRLAEALVPPRTIIISPSAEVGRHHGASRARVRGFAPEVLADVDLVASAVRLDLHRLGADRVELQAGIPEDTVRALNWELRRDGVDLLVHQDADAERPSRARLLVTDLGPGLVLASPRPAPLVRTLKRAADAAGSALLLLVLSPVLLVVAALIRLDDGGPVLCRQERIGLDGDPFRILTFRCRAAGTETLSNRLGPRLHRSGLDRLPQLLNVLRGSMSLVGPRPRRPEETTPRETRFSHLFGVRPGMTGPWMLSAVRRPSPEDARDRDDSYVDTWTPWKDLMILLRCLPAAATGKGARR